MNLPNDLTSFTATIIRFGRGVFPRVTAERRHDPDLLLELYDFEACPYCRKVREVLSELDLDYRARPVAQGSARRAELVRRGGKMQAPYLVDPNTATELYESDDIIRYLNATYGEGERAGWRLPVPTILDDVNSSLASAVRLGRGSRCRRAGRRERFEPLTLFNMEGSRTAGRCARRSPSWTSNTSSETSPRGAPSVPSSRGGAARCRCRTWSIRIPAARCTSRTTSSPTSKASTPRESRP